MDSSTFNAFFKCVSPAFIASTVKQFVIAISIFCKWLWLYLLQKQYQNKTDSYGLTNTQVMIDLMWVDFLHRYL